MNFGGWLHLQTAGDVWHVVPWNDLEDHQVDGCPCCPDEDEFGLVVHQSFDGREAYEMGLRKVH